MANINGWKEIILTTTRNMQGDLLDKGIYVDSEILTNEIYAKLLRQPIHLMPVEKIIDFIKLTFQSISTQYGLKDG